MRKVFVTFADNRLHRSMKRILNQARVINVYDLVIGFSESNLRENFFKEYGKYLKSNVRGFGYWCWKPQIIKQVFDELDDGDLVHYCDVGCEINLRGKDRLVEYINMTCVDEVGILGFQSKLPIEAFEYDGRALLDLTEAHWTKGDLLDYFGVRNNPSITNTQQIGSGIFLMKKCRFTESFIEAWLDVYRTSFSLADDTPSVSSNLEGFVEHRHDQSIFSILCKLNKVKTISAYEYWYPQKKSLKKADWSALGNMPIHAARNRDFGFNKNLMYFLQAKYRGLKSRLKSLLCL